MSRLASLVLVHILVAATWANAEQPTPQAFDNHSNHRLLLINEWDTQVILYCRASDSKKEWTRVVIEPYSSEAITLVSKTTFDLVIQQSVSKRMILEYRHEQLDLHEMIANSYTGTIGLTAGKRSYVDGKWTSEPKKPVAVYANARNRGEVTIVVDRILSRHFFFAKRKR